MTDIRTRWLLTILLLALVTRVVAAIAVGGSFKFADEAIYVDTARRLTGGDGFGTGYRGVPAYPVFIALLSLGFPVGVTFLRLVQVVVAGLGAGLVVLLADRLFGRRPAVLAGLVYALDPLLVIASPLFYPETLAALVLVLALLLVLEGSERDRSGFTALAGLLFGVLALLRPVAQLLPPVVAVWIALTSPARPKLRLVHVGVLVLSFLLALAPWTVRNYRVHGALVPISTAGLHTTPSGGEDVLRRGLVRSLADWARAHPAQFISRTGRQFLQFWELSPSGMSTDDPATRAKLHQSDPRLPAGPIFHAGLRDLVSAVSFGPELALALGGLLLVGRTRWRRASLPLAVILAYAAGHALFVATLRYRMTVLPLVFLFTGVGIAELVARIRHGASVSSRP